MSDDEDGGGTAVNRVGRPQVVVIGGPNGAGKTSAAPELLRDTVGVETFVNADLIAEGLAGFSPQSAALEAGRVMLDRLDELTRIRADFAFESTLAGRSVARRLRDLVDLGYDVHVLYLWLLRRILRSRGFGVGSRPAVTMCPNW